MACMLAMSSKGHNMQGYLMASISTYTSYLTVNRDIKSSLSTVASQSSVAKDTAYYKEKNRQFYDYPARLEAPYPYDTQCTDFATDKCAKSCNPMCYPVNYLQCAKGWNSTPTNLITQYV